MLYYNKSTYVHDPRLVLVQCASLQHFALKVCLHQWNSNYNDCLHAVHLPSLSARYALAKLTLLYKIKNSLVFFPSGYIHCAHVSAYALRHQHSSNIFIPFFRTESGLNSFLPSAAALWNSLPSHIQDLNSLFSLHTHTCTLSYTHAAMACAYHMLAFAALCWVGAMNITLD